MPDDLKVAGPLDGSGFAGTTKSFTVLRGGRGWEACRNCGSTLYPSRLESRKLRVIGGESVMVDKYRCGCKTGREIRRPLEAAA